MTKTKNIAQPIAKIITKTLQNQDSTRNDDYFWMNERENPDVVKYLEKENEYKSHCLKKTEPLQKVLFEEMKGRIKEDDASVPYFKNGYFYYNRFEKGKEYPIYCRKEGNLDADEKTLLNINTLAEGHEYMNVNALAVAENNQLLAYSFDNVGRRIYTIHFKDLISGEVLEDQLKSVTGNLAWAADNATVFYTQQDSMTLRPNKIFRHVLGQPQESDELIYEETDETFTVGLKKSKSRKFLFIASHSTISSEYRFLPVDQPEENWKVIQERQDDLEYEVDHYEQHFIILTNADKATNFKLVKTPIDKPEKENWEDIIPARENVFLEEFEVFKHHLVIANRFNGLQRLEIRSWDGDKKHTIRMEDPAYTVWIGNNPEFYTDVLRYGYNSLTTPATVYDYNMESRDKTLMKRQEVVGGHTPEDYQSERVWATSKDGTEIPISLVYKKDLFHHDGQNPVLLNGYGSYGLSSDPYFSSSRLSLLDRGFVFAIAHIRGGQEMGRHWYEDGKMLKKKNTFEDFIACGEYLIQEKYSHPKKLFAIGGSAGGLLVGAVINQRPDLFHGVVAAVPFVDVVTTMLDESIPLTTGEFNEWGNPKEKPYYDYMLSYSPYDNVKAQDYPHLLVTSGLHDSQVQYWEPTKWVAKLRALRSNQNLLLLHTNMEAGHGGASGRFSALKELAMEYAFILLLAEN
ncbi:S9 family peptidase [Cyclobacterium qasimii]|uniref:Proline-specific endopeptidase n=2 Tax=Cyclobacterium qasimii TaxID=1350429 RepID=S7WMR8_9BACT|nr:S9 family peptidase [Cyclobacterium qasimii]EPR68024.1 Protease II [Cyclobacterium qasimii M12-11B]GEO22975.1 oligopeptidase B [Cyclobacterium qasimii]